MRKSVLFGVFIMLLLAVPMTGAQENSEGVSLTIYNQGTALVQDRRSFDLPAGVSTLDFTDVAASIDPTSVSFVSITDPQGTVVLEQNYVYDLVGSGALLSRYVDETISVTTEDGETFSGQLLSGRNNEIILRDESGQVYLIGLSKVRNIVFPSLPDGLITRPTLRWLLSAAQAGSQQVELTYLTGGLNWSADYIVLLGAGNTALDLNGWITLNNTSGASFTDARLKLVAGDVNRLPQPGMMMRAEMEDIVMLAGPAAPPVEQRDIFEYKLYEITRPVTVADNETKQVEFVTGVGVPANTFYVYQGSPPFYGYYNPIHDQGYGMTGVTTVQSWLEFSTGAAGGLDADLPAGRIRVYQEDIDGAALLIGENRISHTPKGEDITIFLGNAFDLVGERSQTDFQIIGRNVIEETYEIRLRNRKEDQTVEIRVPESLFRWSNWQILNASDSYTQIDSANIEFRVQVEPGQEKVITYTVRYSWSS
jgi:hypothetical protein